MSLKIKYSKSSVPVDWNWPIQIGFIKKLVDSNIRQQSKKFHWITKLAHMHLVNRVRRKTNILVLNGNLEQINNSLRDIDFTIKTDLLILFLESGEIMPRFYNQTVKKLQNIRYNSFFLTLVPKDQSYLVWLDELIFRLSHNTNFDTAVKEIGGRGILVTSREMVRESRLDKVLDKILDKIKKSTKYKNYKFDKVISKKVQKSVDQYSGRYTDVPKKSSADIIKDVKEKKEAFQYDHETDESALIKDISVNHSANVSDMVEKIGEEMEELADADKTGARYLQCLFRDKKEKPIHHALLINQPYTLTVKIGVPDEVFLLGGEVSKDDVAVQPGKEERVDILLRYRDNMDQKHIMLPYKGSSTEAIFNVNIAEEGETHFEIFAFHKNRLFQQIDLSVFLCKYEEDLGNVPGMKIEMINLLRTTLNDFELKNKYGLSLVFTDGFPVLSQGKKITEIRDEDHINKFNEQLTEIIEKYVKSRNPNEEDLIFALTEQGSLLYKNLFDDSSVFDRPIQIISSSSRHFPIEFLYTYKLHRKAEKLCPNAGKALQKGKCSDCNSGDEKYICPFGFLSLRTVIERHRVGENVDMINPDSVGLKTDVSMNRPAIPILKNTLFGTTEKVDASQAGLRKRLRTKIKESSGSSLEALDWDQWYDGIKSRKPDSLVIIGHVEPSKRGGSNQLEIGTDLLRQTLIDEECVRASKAQTQPFMVLIGCNTQDIELSFLDFTNQFKKCGAAIVLSTFTKIRGSQAVPLVEKLVEILHSNKGKEIPFGKAMLDLRRKLFADGLYVSMAMVSHGDADWKLKI